MISATELLKNKKLPAVSQSVFDRMIAEGENVLFAIVGDLSLNGRYAENVLFFLPDAVVFVDESGGEVRYPFADLREVASKRMYGNATLSAVMLDGRRRVFFRYTYAVASLCDAAALFIRHLREGAALAEECAVMAVTFERAFSVCPRCGRTLLHPGAECIMCRSKKKIAKKLFLYIRPSLPLLVFCIFLSLFTTAMALVPPAITGYIVDRVFVAETAQSAASLFDGIARVFGPAPRQVLITMILCLLFTYFLQHLIGAVRAYLMRKIGDKAISALRNDIYRKAQYLPMRFYDRTSTGSIINRIASDSATIQQFMLRVSQEAVVHLFQMIGIVLIMLLMNPSLTLLSLLPIPLIVIATRFFTCKIRPFYRRIWRRWASLFATLSDTIPCIKVVKSFTGERRAAQTFEKKNAEWLSMDLKLGKLAAAFPQFVAFFTACGSLVIWAVGGTRVIDGIEGYSAGLIVSFISYASMFYTPVSFFANLSDSYQGALASTEKILDILEAEPETHAEHHVAPDKLKGKIEFLHVSFSFDRTKKVLDDVTLTIEPGEVIGIVGTTGSGKSTLVNLLMRFYDGYSGEILVDGHNIKNFDLSAYRSQIGYVQQEPQMFTDTIYHNIAYSAPDATVEEVIRAADIANAHAFISRQPDAYDTMLGERGVGVSGGERQRISIARAVLMNPSILIFDEATAAVDSETERLIQNAIDKLVAGKTTLMIAHRLSTLSRADRIVVVDNGRIIENGSPEELMAARGKYYKLVQIQSMAQKSERMREEERF